jgi:hypothetical protein
MRKIILAVISVLVLIQFIPVKRDNPLSEPANEIPINAETKLIIVRSCYDCHSNKTIWPIYSYVAPVSWFVSNHVTNGRKHLNFSEWNSYPEKRKNKKLEEIVEEINEGGMPLPSYLILHSDAKLSQNDKQLIKTEINALVSTKHIQTE